MEILLRWGKRNVAICSGCRTTGCWPEQPLNDTWNLQINDHSALSLSYPEYELHRFCRKIMETFNITPPASSSSPWGSGYTFRIGRYTHIISATGTETALESANKVLQLMISGCLLDTLFFQMVKNPQETFCAIVIHSTKSCLHLFSTVHACQPVVNRMQQGSQPLVSLSRKLDNVSIGEERES